MASDYGPFLTKAGSNFLTMLRDSEDQYAIQDGLEVWIDSRRFHSGTVQKLLRMCLIKYEDSNDFGAKVRHYVITEDGSEILANPKHVPRIVQAIQAQRQPLKCGIVYFTPQLKR